MPKVKPGQSRKGKNKAPKTTTQRDQSSSTGLSAEAEQALIDKISNSVVDKLKKGGPTTEHEGEENFNVDLVHDTDNEAEMDVESVTDGSYNNWEKPTNTGAIYTPISALIDEKLKQQIWKDQYIDLALLLPQNNTSTNKKGLQFQVVANSTLSVIPNKPRYSLYNIEQWTMAFIRFMAIYAEKFPEAIPHLANHAEMVREMATSHNNNAWFVYDQRVRMDRQARGLPWEVFNVEFYIMATRARDSNFFRHLCHQR